MLRRYTGFKPKREHTNSCTPCLTLKPEIACKDLCCRQFLVVLAQEDLDDGLLTLPPFVDVLKKAVNGSCHYFEEATGNCGVWHDRPLVCRTYDCRDDVRVTMKLRHGIRHPIETLFDNSYPESCTHCERPLRLCAGVSYQTDGQGICIDCGQPYEMQFNYRDCFFRIEPIGGVHPDVRRRNLLVCLCYREQWTEAFALLEIWCAEDPEEVSLRRQRALMLAELGRTAEARQALEGLREGDRSVELDLAWLDTRNKEDASAKKRVESVMDYLAPHEELRAHLQLGSIARRADRLEEASRHFQKAILLDRAHSSHGDGIKEYLLELMHADEATRTRVERGLLDRPRF